MGPLMAGIFVLLNKINANRQKNKFSLFVNIWDKMGIYVRFF